MTLTTTTLVQVLAFGIALSVLGALFVILSGLWLWKKSGLKNKKQIIQ